MVLSLYEHLNFLDCLFEALVGGSFSTECYSASSPRVVPRRMIAVYAESAII